MPPTCHPQIGHSERRRSGDPLMDVGRLVARAARRYASRIAVEGPGGTVAYAEPRGRVGAVPARARTRCQAARAAKGPDGTVTYAELGDRVARLARGLRSLGLQPGDRV